MTELEEHIELQKLPYIEKLRHPKWQKYRLEILQRDGFKCRECDDGNTNLQVHHKFYVKSWLPWYYPSEALITLCDKCHKDFEREKSLIISTIFSKFSRYEELNLINEIFENINSMQDLVSIKELVDNLNAHGDEGTLLDDKEF